MPTYTVEWSMVYDADNEVQAVLQAVGEMRDPASTATYFRVTNEETGESTIRDYEEAIDQADKQEWED